MNIKSLILAGCLASFAFSAQAQNYPSQSVTLILPTGSGTSMDTLGRFLADGLSKRWSQTVVTENRPGAGGILGSSVVAQSKSDGYTLMLMSSSFSSNALSDTLPFDAVKDFTPVALVAKGDFGIVGGTRIPAKTLKELVEYGKANKVFFGMSGPTTSSRYAAEIFAKDAGIELEPVDYKSSTDIMVDIGGKRLDIYVGAVASMVPSVDNDRIIPLAVMSEKRSSAWPDVPTTSEVGFPGARFDLYWGVFGPAGLEPEVVAKLNADINDVMSTPESVTYLAKLGAFPAPGSSAEFGEYVRGDIEKLKQIDNEK